MHLVSHIKGRLTASELARAKEFPGGIEVPSERAGGFTVAIFMDDGRYTVYFDGWHEHFDNQALAVKSFGASSSRSGARKP